MRHLIMTWLDKLTLRSNKRCTKCGKRLGDIEAAYYGFICERCEKAYYSH